MVYFKARQEKYDYFTGFAVVENELLTAKERNTKARYIPDFNFQVVDIPKTNTFKIFGVRFEKT